MNLNSLGLVVSGMTCLWVHSLMMMTLPCYLPVLLLLGGCCTSASSLGPPTMLRFNPDNTQCIKFSRTCTNGLVVFFFCGKSIFCAKSVLHLGHVLTCNLMDNLTFLDALVISVSKQMVLF